MYNPKHCDEFVGNDLCKFNAISYRTNRGNCAYEGLNDLDANVQVYHGNKYKNNKNHIHNTPS